MDDLLARGWIEAADDAALRDAVAAIQGEQRRRALAAGDPHAACEDAFDNAFDGARMPGPYLHGTLLVCPGLKVDRGINHDCGFHSIDGEWSWESPHVILDELRPGLAGRHQALRTVTILPAIDGLQVDHVMSRTRSGVHEMRQLTSYTIVNGQLEQVATRSRKAAGHGGR